MWAADFLAFARSMPPDARLRLAPTPSGYLHLGNALNFTLNWLAARVQPGPKLLLRIDDLDADRKRQAYVSDVFESLHWLGLDWDEGPMNPTDFEDNWSQHRRMDLYKQALQELRATGFLYACAKSRQDLAPFGGAYPLEFRNQKIDLDAPDVAWRVVTPPGFALPDFIVRRRDGLPAYQLASLVDDRHFGISHIIRGADLATSTAAQQWLAQQLGWTEFSNIHFLHHPLLTDEQGQKLSKSAGSASLQALRETAGQEQVFQQLGALFGEASIKSAGEMLALLRSVL